MSRNIKKIVLHHSATPRDLSLAKSLTSFNNNHKKRLYEKHKQPLSWTERKYIAYHYVISWDGTTIKTRSLDKVWYHASDRKINRESIGICLTGNFDEENPTKQQVSSLKKLISKLRSMQGGLTVHWHNEYVPKTCPGRNMNFMLSIFKTMTFYKDIYQAEFGEKQDKVFKDPEGAVKRIIKSSDPYGEIVYLIAILAERLDADRK